MELLTRSVYFFSMRPALSSLIFITSGMLTYLIGALIVSNVFKEDSETVSRELRILYPLSVIATLILSYFGYVRYISIKNRTLDDVATNINNCHAFFDFSAAAFTIMFIAAATTVSVNRASKERHEIDETYYKLSIVVTVLSFIVAVIAHYLRMRG